MSQQFSRLGTYFLAALALVCIVWLPASAEDLLPQAIDRCPFSGRFPVEIRSAGPFEFQALQPWDLDIDDVRGAVVTAYVDDDQFAALEKAGFEIAAIPNQARRAWAAAPKSDLTREDYHTYSSLTTELQQIAGDYPDIVQLFSIGTSIEGRQLWVLKISDNADMDEAEPEFKFTATIHGDEPPGTEMCVYLIRLLTQNYGADPELTALVDDLEIYFCPLHNPDGLENGTRYNADGDDLNRSFPDPRTDPNDTPVGRPTEVQHMMNFCYPRNFVLGANYHTGELVMNYPWDTWDGQYSPDDDLFVEICEGYSVLNPPMWDSGEFENGITIGWAWYVISGGLQDWSYHWRNELHVTIEMSEIKWPASSNLATLWNNNRDAMLYYMSQARIGVEGLVTDAVGGQPIEATVDVIQIGKDILSDEQHGFYHRMLLPGTYSIQFSAPGYYSQTINNVVVTAGATTTRNVQLARDPSAWNTVSGVVTESGSGTPLAADISVRRHAGGELFDATTSDPVSGAYTIDVLDGAYDFTAEADGHAPVTEVRTISTHTTINFSLASIQATVLLVLDNNASSRFSADLPALGYLVTEETNWTTDPATWDEYDLLVWSAGSYGNPVSNATLRSAIENHVAAGRRLLIEGGELGRDALVSPGYPTFAANVLHVASHHLDNAGQLDIKSTQTGHPLANNPNDLPSSIAITYDNYADQDAVTPRAEGAVIFGTHSYPNDAGVLIYEPATRGQAQVAYYAFDFDALTSAAAGTDLLENTLVYLLEGSPQEVPERPAISMLALGRPMPTPTSGETNFRLRLPRSANVSVALYDVAGRRVRELLNGTIAGGDHPLVWDGLDAAGRAVSPGVYFVKAVSPQGTAVQRLVMIR
ncbi:MAG: M14 family zinc carboxypeptidase [Candidatus Eisenbacteria bacterium]